MTTREYLGQIIKFDALIDNKTIEIEQLRAMAESMTVPTDNERVQSSGDKDKVGKIVAMLTDKEKELEDTILKYYKRKETIIYQIEQIPDVKEYQMLFYKYICGLPTNEIASRMGYVPRHVNLVCAQARDRFERMYGDLYLDIS